MPWSVQTPMTQRQDCVEDAVRGLYAMTDLCARYGISRRVGYKWLARYRAQGLAGLTDRSRRPDTSPRQLDAELQDLLLATRRAHPLWGPRKILAYLAARSRRPARASPASRRTDGLPSRGSPPAAWSCTGSPTRGGISSHRGRQSGSGRTPKRPFGAGARLPYQHLHASLR